MIKTSIDLTSRSIPILKIKALERKMRGEDPSFVTILRELIDEGHKQWKKNKNNITIIEKPNPHRGQRIYSYPTFIRKKKKLVCFSVDFFLARGRLIYAFQYQC